MTKKSIPKDSNQLGKYVIDLSTKERAKNAAAVALGRLGGLKGGAARAASMTPQERTEAARKAVQARWKNKKSKNT